MPTPLEHLRADSKQEWQNRICQDIVIAVAYILACVNFTNHEAIDLGNLTFFLSFASGLRALYALVQADQVQKKETHLAIDDLEERLAALDLLSHKSLTYLYALVKEAQKTGTQLSDIALAMRDLANGGKKKTDFSKNQKAIYTVATRFFSTENQDLMLTFGDVILDWSSSDWKKTLQVINKRINKQAAKPFTSTLEAESSSETAPFSDNANFDKIDESRLNSNS